MGEYFCPTNLPGLGETREPGGPGEQGLEAREKSGFVLFLEAFNGGGGGGSFWL